MCSFAKKIAIKDFSPKVVKALSSKGVEICGVSAMPIDGNDVYFGSTCYTVTIGGVLSAQRTFAQLQTMANSSWDAKEF